MKIVFLETKSLGLDLDFSVFEQMGETVLYEETSEEQIAKRLADADIAIVNKIRIDESALSRADRLKLVCVTATGTDNLDKEYLNNRGIQWRNAAGYSTENVAQHTFALLLFLMENLDYYNRYVKSGQYARDTVFSHFSRPIYELNHKIWGIIGMGTIGRRVAELAKAFGCHVIYYSSSGKDREPAFERVDLNTLLKESDIVSVHAALTPQTENLMNAEAFAKMKPEAFFINTGRGAIVDEGALANALENRTIAGAGLDVLRQEPMSPDCPLARISDSGRLVITPHTAWAARKARERLMNIVAEHVRTFVDTGR